MIREALEQDAETIVSLIRTNSDASRLKWTIWSSPNVVNYVRHMIRRHGDPNALFLVAELSGVVRGVAEFRRTDEHLFLNHIYTDASVRGQGIGSRLLVAGIALMTTSKTRKLALDVVASNTRAITWYTKLGFVEVERKEWLLFRPIPTFSNHNWECTGQTEADKIHAEWGFSEILIRTETGSYRIGRLGEHSYRLLGAHGITDDALITALHTLDSTRDLLVICSEGTFPSVGLTTRRVSNAIRMQAPVSAVLTALS